MTVTMFAGEIDLVSELKKTFGADLLALYAGSEPSGATMLDGSGNGYNGTYSGTTPGIVSPVGTLARRLDAVNDGGTWYGAGVDAAWSWSAVTMLVFGRINSADVWSDGTTRYAIRAVDATLARIFQITKHTAANQLLFECSVSGSNPAGAVSLGGTLDWFAAALTFSDANDRARYYYARKGTPTTLLSSVVQANSPTGALDTNRCTIGVGNISTFVGGWDGDMWPAVIIKREATLDELKPFMDMVV